jgi:hypothetical protein
MRRRFNLNREIEAATRRIMIAFGVVALMAAVFWLIFWVLS